MDPTVYEMLALEYAIESHNDFERYGLPHEGGLKDQPAVWKMATDCVKDALAAGTAQARVEARNLQQD